MNLPMTSRQFSPQAWGWTVWNTTLEAAHDVFPTGVGVDRMVRQFPTTLSVFPTGVGVDRAAEALLRLPLPFSPQAWGWTVKHAVTMNGRAVFPTGVGVDRRNL